MTCKNLRNPVSYGMQKFVKLSIIYVLMHGWYLHICECNDMQLWHRYNYYSDNMNALLHVLIPGFPNIR